VSDTRTLHQILADCRKQFARGALPAPRGRTPAASEPARSVEPAVNPTLPPSFRWATLDAPELRQRVGRERAIAEGEAALSSPGLLLVGPSGSGKTSLACALLRAWEARSPRRRGVFAPAWRLGVARAQHGLGQGEPHEVDRAMDAALLVLDDVGSERNTATNAVPDVIFARAFAGLPTWVTTWMTPEAVTQRYGDGVARRLYEAGRVVVIGCGRAGSGEGR
jgi:DNA replication protein DnaC